MATSPANFLETSARNNAEKRRFPAATLSLTGADICQTAVGCGLPFAPKRKNCLALPYNYGFSDCRDGGDKSARRVGALVPHNTEWRKKA